MTPWKDIQQQQTNRGASKLKEKEKKTGTLSRNFADDMGGSYGVGSAAL